MTGEGARDPDPTAPVDDSEYPGQRLGMPETGPGSVAGTGRRLIALGIDWGLCSVVVYTVLGLSPAAASYGYAVLSVYAIQAVLLQMLVGSTVGKRVVGIRMGSTGGGALPWPTALVVRTLLLCLVIPAAITDQDRRGLHDRIAGTVSARI
ncbi:RDD family protein [Lipingzhangella sp. LS1_29]|uniref:RDD family protein n=1 Tax=Lipingzhangella rawalii TaxID=2055835 RepID=A0ABU2H3D7_9ACTN|nr:RDD family protein [Lipingzhangella rawalii]MDS1269507.1 RDD family protein [Lipingzhangella rawalii]